MNIDMHGNVLVIGDRVTVRQAKATYVPSGLPREFRARITGIVDASDGRMYAELRQLDTSPAWSGAVWLTDLELADAGLFED